MLYRRRSTVFAAASPTSREKFTSKEGRYRKRHWMKWTLSGKRPKESNGRNNHEQVPTPHGVSRRRDLRRRFARPFYESVGLHDPSTHEAGGSPAADRRFPR